MVKTRLDDVTDREHTNSESFETKLEDLKFTIGNKPNNISEEYDTPNLWTTMSDFIQKTKNSQAMSFINMHDDQITRIQSSLPNLEHKLQRSIFWTQTQLVS